VTRGKVRDLNFRYAFGCQLGLKPHTYAQEANTLGENDSYIALLQMHYKVVLTLTQWSLMIQRGHGTCGIRGAGNWPKTRAAVP
jgi:hypothetical protein